MLVDRMDISDSRGNRVSIAPCGAVFALRVGVEQVNGGQTQEILITPAVLRQLSRMLKLLETPA